MMHSERWLTGLIAFPILIVLIFWGGALGFAVFIGLIFLIAQFEYYRIVYHNADTPDILYFKGIGFCIGLFMILSAYRGSAALIMVGAGVGLFLSVVVACYSYSAEKNQLAVVAKQIQGMVYLPGSLSLLLLTHSDVKGPVWIFGVLLMIMAGDTGAFYAGTYLGKHKLCPAISPKKTIEGLLGGIGSVYLVGVVYQQMFLPHMGTIAMIVFCALVGVVGPVGDLFESMLKREAGIKDSGQILPGHGGILDRIDALLFAIPIMFIFYTMHGAS